MRHYKKVFAFIPINTLLAVLFFALSGLCGCYGTKKAEPTTEPAYFNTRIRPARESINSTKSTISERESIDLTKSKRPKRKVVTFDADGHKVTSFGAVTQTFTLPVKFYKQKPDQCGVAALKSVLEYFNVRYSHKELNKIFNKDINGTKVISIVNYANKHLNTHSKRIGYEQMVRILKKGDPLIIMRRHDEGNHYYVVKGYIVNEKKIVVNDGYKEDVILPMPDKRSATDTDVAIIFSKRG